MTRPLLRLMLLAGLTALVGCSEHLNTAEDQYTDWQARNVEAFDQEFDLAKNAIATAKAQYGVDWEQNCSYRLYRNYQLVDSRTGTRRDSIIVRIIDQGAGDICPLYTDTVRYNYIGRLLPTDTDPTGKMFSHSGTTIYPADIFSPTTSVPYKACVRNMNAGVATALMQMHIGDRWIVTIPPELGYGDDGTSSIPGYSNLYFEMQLKAFYHPGPAVPDWQ